MNMCSKVREFTEVCNDNLPNRPSFLTAKEISFVDEMVNDELIELMEAKSINEQADALVDAIYYLCDAAAKKGINLDPIFEIVHQANMSKIIDGKVNKREDGKIRKPLGWIDPDPFIKAEIDFQIQRGSFNDE